MTVSSMKRYLAMVKKNSRKQPEENDLGSIYGMYAEVRLMLRSSLLLNLMGGHFCHLELIFFSYLFIIILLNSYNCLFT